VSEHNRKIYLSTDYDRYRPGEIVRLFFSTVSDFGFGIRPNAALVTDATGTQRVATAQARLKTDSGDVRCLRIEDRLASRFIRIDLPARLAPGRYRIKIDFCDRPFEQMPAATVSNEIEVLESRP
jgi:hypothetical protein